MGLVALSAFLVKLGFKERTSLFDFGTNEISFTN